MARASAGAPRPSRAWTAALSRHTVGRCNLYSGGRTTGSAMAHRFDAPALKQTSTPPPDWPYSRMAVPHRIGVPPFGCSSHRKHAGNSIGSAHRATTLKPVGKNGNSDIGLAYGSGAIVRALWLIRRLFGWGSNR